jgi:tetratricopeptide (TPR) repeat protein
MAKAFVVACTVAGLAASIASYQTVPAPAPLASPRALAFNDIDLGRLSAWLAAAGAHRAGQADAPATTIAGWSAATLAYTVTDVVSLLKMRAALTAAGISAPRKYRGRNFCVCPNDAADINTLFGLPNDGQAGPANLILERGAMLHTDIAMLIPTPSPAAGGGGVQTTVHQSDGEVTGADNSVDQWRYARYLLEGVLPDPAREAFVLAWYRATSAWQANQLRWSDAIPNLARAGQIFPQDPRIQFFIGVMHEVFATPATQSGAQDLVRAGLFEGVVTQPKELALAETALKKSLASDPAGAEVRLHLGRVVGLLGLHDGAIRELTAAQAGLTEPLLTYYAMLFLGNEQDIAGYRDEARASFDRAEALFPGAQSALLAQSRLARRNGDSPGALGPLERLLVRPAGDSRPPDPWPGYGGAHVRDAQALLDDVRRSIESGVRK